MSTVPAIRKPSIKKHRSGQLGSQITIKGQTLCKCPGKTSLIPLDEGIPVFKPVTNEHNKQITHLPGFGPHKQKCPGPPASVTIPHLLKSLQIHKYKLAKAELDTMSILASS